MDGVDAVARQTSSPASTNRPVYGSCPRQRSQARHSWRDRWPVARVIHAPYRRPRPLTGVLDAWASAATAAAPRRQVARVPGGSSHAARRPVNRPGDRDWNEGARVSPPGPGMNAGPGPADAGCLVNEAGSMACDAARHLAGEVARCVRATSRRPARIERRPTVARWDRPGAATRRTSSPAKGQFPTYLAYNVRAVATSSVPPIMARPSGKMVSVCGSTCRRSRNGLRLRRPAVESLPARASKLWKRGRSLRFGWLPSLLPF
jgi:hypothetical protein